MSASTTTRTPRTEVTLSRTFAAPRSLVWKAWTDANLLARWWGPDGFPNPVCEVDVRVGGTMRIDMQAPDGTVHRLTGTFDEVAEPECLVFRAIAVDDKSVALMESLTTVTFHDLGDKTKVIVHASAAPRQPIAADMLKGMDMGWAQSLERLARLVAQR